jgi:hypothetical protein
VVPQYHTEQVLGERARALGVEIVHGVELTRLHQDLEGADVDVRGREGTTAVRGRGGPGGFRCQVKRTGSSPLRPV